MKMTDGFKKCNSQLSLDPVLLITYGTKGGLHATNPSDRRRPNCFTVD
jgi:hypothetical protein